MVSSPTQIRQADDTGSTIGSQYGVSPESPDGTRICYARYPQLLSTRPEGEEVSYTAELWVCNRDLANHRKLTTVHNANLHNGLSQQWVTNDSIVIATKGAGVEVSVIDADTGDVRHGPYAWYELGHNGQEGKALVTNAKPHFSAAMTEQPHGIYELDCRTGDTHLVVSATEIKETKIQGGRHLHQNEVRVNHAQYAPNGERIAFLADTNHVGVVNTDGSDLEFFAGRKPMHFQWFDNDSLFGHSHSSPLPDSEHPNPFLNDSPADYKLHRWNLSERKRVELLGGYGCHPAASPDRRQYVTEDWYHSDQTTLRVYDRGEDVPSEEIFSTNHDIIWASRAHVNPNFSRDGSRVYYTKPVGPHTVQMCFSEVE